MNKELSLRSRILIGLSAALLIAGYLSGLLTQVLSPGTNRVQTGVDWTGNPIYSGSTSLTFNPFKNILFAFSTSTGLLLVVTLLGTAGVILLFKYFDGDGREFEDERNFKKSKKGTYGTSGWMSKEEFDKILECKPIEKTVGTILGIHPTEGKVVSLPQDAKINKHTAIFGASGTGKSRCFVRGQILQCVEREESIIITDPKGEIYADTAEFMRLRGYDVKMFNLVDPKYSDSWNCLAEIISNPENVELMAQTFAQVIVNNTNEGKPDPFFSNAEMNLLKALSLYVATVPETEGEPVDPDNVNVGAVYDMLTSKTDAELIGMFSKLDDSHPASKAWGIHMKGSENVRGNVVIALGARLQVFQAPVIRSITNHREIDLEGPAIRKTAYFVIMSDQDSTLDFLSSLFFAFLFIRLVRYADVKGKNGACDVPVNFILDEFPNIGSIPDFTKKLSTIRSRDLRVAVIFQNIAQLQNRYPNGLWEEIVGNCDTQLFLGCTDQMTSKFISERTGEMTIEVSSENISRKSIALTQSNPEYRESHSAGKRYVLTPDEVMRLPNEECLVILRGQKVLKLKKFDFSNHPGHLNFVHTYVRDYTPKWRKEAEQEAERDRVMNSKTTMTTMETAFTPQDDSASAKSSTTQKEPTQEIGIKVGTESSAPADKEAPPKRQSAPKRKDTVLADERRTSARNITPPSTTVKESSGEPVLLTVSDAFSASPTTTRNNKKDKRYNNPAARSDSRPDTANSDTTDVTDLLQTYKQTHADAYVPVSVGSNIPRTKTDINGNKKPIVNSDAKSLRFDNYKYPLV